MMSVAVAPPTGRKRGRPRKIQLPIIDEIIEETSIVKPKKMVAAILIKKKSDGSQILIKSTTSGVKPKFKIALKKPLLRKPKNNEEAQYSDDFINDLRARIRTHEEISTLAQTAAPSLKLLPLPEKEERKELQATLIKNKKTPRRTFNEVALNEANEESYVLKLPFYDEKELRSEANSTLYDLRSEVTQKTASGFAPLTVLKDRSEVAAISKKLHNNSLIKNKLDIIIYSDGGYSETKDIGTWAYIIQLRSANSPSHLGNWIQSSNHGPILKAEPGEFYDTEDKALMMEMTAVLEAISMIKRYEHRLDLGDINIYSDSKNMCEWEYNLDCYIKNGWYNEYKRRFIPEKMKIFWMGLKRMAEEFNVTFTYVKGHSGDFFNEHVNQLCQLQRLLSESGEMGIERLHHFRYI